MNRKRNYIVLTILTVTLLNTCTSAPTNLLALLPQQIRTTWLNFGKPVYSLDCLSDKRLLICTACVMA